MARSENGGWDFIKVGKTYQYKEDGGGIGNAVVGMVKILEDTSDDEWYNFLVQVTEGKTALEVWGDKPIPVGHKKNIGGIYSGMPQFYETPVYCLGNLEGEDKNDKAD